MGGCLAKKKKYIKWVNGTWTKLDDEVVKKLPKTLLVILRLSFYILILEVWMNIFIRKLLLKLSLSLPPNNRIRRAINKFQLIVFIYVDMER